MRVAYVTSYHPNDRRQWSGLGYAIMNCLVSQGIDVTPIGPLKNNFHLIGDMKRQVYSRLFDLSYDFRRSGVLARDYARQVQKHLKRGFYDAVFSPSTIPISRLRCSQPIAIWVDATWACYFPHYKIEPPWCHETIQAGHVTESLAYKRCELLFFASQWAADSAIKDYGVEPDKVRVVPFGSNFVKKTDPNQVLRSISERSLEKCRLIAIGVDWYRKGMPRAVELAAVLNAVGQPTDLVIVGCEAPPNMPLPKFVRVEGFIDKRSPEGEQRLASLLMQSHFHVLFSTAEAFGIVFAEANAHAVPNITWDIGGISSAVVNDKGGWCFNVHSPVSEIANFIKHCLLDRNRYAALALNAFREYEQRLNWDISGTAVAKDLEAFS
jgi:glycosyltransferase involved in cell wall biosynthesis